MNLMPPGVFSGTTTELGDFDQCLSINGAFNKSQFVGKYCLATVNLPRDDKFQTFALNRSVLKHEWLGDALEMWYHNDNFYAPASAVCFPSICHESEIKHILMECKFVCLFSFDTFT